MFHGLNDAELLRLARICRVRRVEADTVIMQEGEEGDELMVIHDGSVKVSLRSRGSDGTVSAHTLTMLYGGQCFGEMVLLGSATRTATVTAVAQCVLLVIKERDFNVICESNPRIGYTVMRNIASELAFKLRSANLLLRGDIRLPHLEV
ncbi:MAG: cyclic nucleotide-binding domain-containing protein [Chloroflexaceae bacterium]|nr:cyclic nucleotide-binding domain-containing protein [Chloroflexaceae bacterium]